MTDRQELILRFLETFRREHDYMPSYREIGEAVGLSSPASVNYQLQQLAALGKIRIREGRQRAIDLLTKEN